MQGKTPTLSQLKSIRDESYKLVNATPVMASRTLSEMVGCRVKLKAELFQKTGSYKPRGMYWAVRQLDDTARKRGVITFSAGNAAQGLAYVGAHLNVPVTVVMPATASPTKAEATRGYGAEVILYGTPQECLAHCEMLAQERGLTFISSYDDYNLMLGHTGLALEIMDQAPNAKAVTVGIGGGGMAGALAIAFTAANHPAQLYGFEPEGAPAMHLSMKSGEAQSLASVSTIADGLAAPAAGPLCFAAVKDRFEAVELVTEDQIAEAMRLLMSRAKLFAEPAGSAALAGLLNMRGQFSKDDEVVCIVSGGNIDLSRLKDLL